MPDADIGGVSRRLLGAGLAVSLPAWWLALRSWAEGTVGYLDVDSLGLSVRIWTGLIIAAAAIVAFWPSAWMRRPVLGTLAGAAIVVAILEVVSGIADGAMSQAAWPVAVISVLQLTLIAAGLFARRG